MSNFFRRVAKGLTRKGLIGGLAVALGAGAWYSLGVFAAPPKADLDQARNGSAASPTSPVFFQNGNAGSSNSHYVEGHSIPYRIVLTDIPVGSSNELIIEWDIKHSSRNAIDFITSYDRLEPHTQYGHDPEVVNPLAGLSGSFGTESTFAIPNPATDASPFFMQLATEEREMSIWNGSITGITYLSHGSLAAAQSSTSAKITFTAASSNIVIAWGGHIAEAADWGEGQSAGGISGAPYHTRLLSFNGSGGNQDRSLSADAVIQAPQTGTVVITKHAIPNDPQDFTFNNDFGGDNPTSFQLDDDSNGTLPNTRSFTVPVGTYAVSEAAVAGWDLTGTNCDDGSLVSAINVGSGETVTCTFTNTKRPTLTVVKVVENNDGGTLQVADFPLFIDGIATTSGTPVVTTIGSHAVTETNQPGYAATFTGDCDGSGVVVLAAGDNKTCTITNRDTAPTLRLVKTVVNDNGGLLEVDDFALFIDGQSVTSGIAVATTAGSHTASETPVAGYTPSAWGGDCAANGSITLALGDTKTCTITNDDQPGTLTVTKVVVNDNGGTALADDFSFQVNGGSVTAFEEDASNSLTVNAGTYSVTEPAVTGYATSYQNCDSIVIPVGGSATCTITNNDIAPKLTLIKNVVNNNGGTLEVDDFPLFVSNNFVVSGEENEFPAGTYTASETTATGYAASVWSGDCAADGAITLSVGDDKTCSITNDDIQPLLTVTKIVTNDNGGTKTVADFPLNVSGASVVSGAQNGFNAGSYTVAEQTDPGYAASSWSGDCAANGAITLAVGDVKSCTITNDDIAPTITLVKTVQNNFGGTKTVADFALFVDGNAVTSGIPVTIAPGTHLATETNLTGYTASAWGGDCTAGGSVTLTVGENKTCTITNSDIEPKLTVTKVVVNDNGGVKEVEDFPLNVSGELVVSGEQNGFNAGSYTVAEQVDAGYLATITGDCAADGSIALVVGDVKSCTITNDDKAASLTVIKQVTNNNGGELDSDDFTMSVTGVNASPSNFPGSLDGTVVTLDAGAYSVSETPVTGYVMSLGENCVGSIANGESKTCIVTNDDQPGTLIVQKNLVNDNNGTATVTDFSFKVNSGSSTVFEGDAENQMTVNAGVYSVVEDEAIGYTTTYENCGQVVVTNGGTATCVITNNDIQPLLTVTKVVITNDGGTKTIADFPLNVSGTTVVSGEQNGFNVGSYTIGEVSDPGYAATITGDCAADGSITLVQGDVKSCTITNDDNPGTLIVQKVVINDNGGTKQAEAFSFAVNAGSAQAFEVDGQNDLTVPAGTYTVVETADPDYSTSYTNCTDVVVTNGGTTTCVITNNDIAPLLTVTKLVINDNGGTKVIADFPLFVDETSVVSGVQNSFAVGSYTVSETESTGYTASIGGDCAADGTVLLGLGDVKTCTIINDDQAGSLIVRKIVVNDNGGTATADDFSFTVNNGVSTFFEVDGENQLTVDAGTYTVVENAAAGYTTSHSNCENVTVVNGESSICTITNDDIAPRLTVTKVVINDNGGTKVVADFPLFVGTTNVVSGQQNNFNAGTYTVSETESAGYTAVVSGDCSAEGQVTLAIGDTKSCTITNNDQAGTLIVQKVLVQDDGGTETVTDFGFTVNNGSATAFETDGQNEMTVNAGLYTIVEPAVAGYTTSYENCTAVEVVNGETETCVITNNDIAPTLTLTKVVVNNNGGLLQVADFPLFIDGNEVVSGQSNTLAAGTYTASETSAAGYLPSGWTGDCDTDGSVTLAVGENLSCTITNDDQPGTLIVQKVVTNDHGGTATADDFSFAVNGGTLTSFEVDGENEIPVNVGTYTVVEDAAAGYDTSYNGCDAVAIGLGETATCVITNNDIAPELTIIKNVINDDGGTLLASAFTLVVTATDPSSTNVTGAADPGVTITLDAGSYEVTEPNALGYAKSFSVDCVGTIAIGETKTCTVTNNDIPQEREGTIGFWRNWNSHKTFSQAQINGWLTTIDADSDWLMPLTYTATTTGLVNLINDATGCKGNAISCTQKKFLAQYLVTRLNIASGKKHLGATYDLTSLPAATSFLGVSSTPTLGDVVNAIEAKHGATLTREQLGQMMTVCDTINNIGL